MIRVAVHTSEPLEKTLKRFKRLCEREGIRKALKRKSYYEKPSERRRREQRERLRSVRKAEKARVKRLAKLRNRKS